MGSRFSVFPCVFRAICFPSSEKGPIHPEFNTNDHPQGPDQMDIALIALRKLLRHIPIHQPDPRSLYPFQGLAPQRIKEASFTDRHENLGKGVGKVRLGPPLPDMLGQQLSHRLAKDVPRPLGPMALFIRDCQRELNDPPIIQGMTFFESESSCGAFPNIIAVGLPAAESHRDEIVLSIRGSRRPGPFLL